MIAAIIIKTIPIKKIKTAFPISFHPFFDGFFTSVTYNIITIYLNHYIPSRLDPLSDPQEQKPEQTFLAHEHRNSTADIFHFFIKAIALTISSQEMVFGNLFTQ